ncbi:MAG TPA: hypothetical protein VLM89_06080 [Phycisphaerae bacterium]|nr:hypothetical protein [Phycisphaerae bacterium]
MTSEKEQHIEAKLGARRRSTLIQIAALAGAAACIAAAAALQKPINEQRKDLGLVLSSDIYKELPPKYAWITAAGGTFRGIAAAILWARAEDLKQEGKYYESHQLAKWICTLQPRFPQVWTFHAWNMSYNISVATHTARERWQWVYNGIRLLRDEGIPNNEKSIPLYHQMAWIWSHKVGNRADDFHWSYKRIWAATMETLLGPPPVGLSNARTIDWFRPVANAPRTLAELTNAHPGVGRLVKALADLDIDVEAGTNTDRVFHPLEERFFKPYTAWRLNQQMVSIRSARQEQQADPDARLRALLADAPADDLAALLAWMRAKVLREQYKMDPHYMLELTGLMGTDEPIPIDWRTPWSQAMYWAKYGLERSAGYKNANEIDFLNTDRILLGSLSDMCTQGLYTFRIDLKEPADSFLISGPDIRYIEAMHRKYLELGKKYADEGEDVGETAGDTLRSGHVNHLRAAIVALYLAGHRDEAQKYLEYLAINYKDMYSGKTEGMYTHGIDHFIHGQLKEMAGSYQETVYIIVSLLSSGYMDLATGWYDRYTAAVQNAAMFHEVYQKEHADDRQGRLTLPLFADMRAYALGMFVVNPAYPMVYRSLAWNREQADIKRRYYDVVAPPLADQCRQEGVDMAKAFPEPPGMEQWRKEHPRSASPEKVSEDYREREKERRAQEKQ